MEVIDSLRAYPQIVRPANQISWVTSTAIQADESLVGEFQRLLD